jgi:hypothetical protein
MESSQSGSDKETSSTTPTKHQKRNAQSYKLSKEKPAKDDSKLKLKSPKKESLEPSSMDDENPTTRLSPIVTSPKRRTQSEAVIPKLSKRQIEAIMENGYIL